MRRIVCNRDIALREMQRSCATMRADVAFDRRLRNVARIAKRADDQLASKMDCAHLPTRIDAIATTQCCARRGRCISDSLRTRKTPALADRGRLPRPAPGRNRACSRGLFGASSLSGRRAMGLGRRGQRVRCPPQIAIRGVILSDRPRWSWRALRASVRRDALTVAGRCRGCCHRSLMRPPWHLASPASRYPRFARKAQKTRGKLPRWDLYVKL